MDYHVLDVNERKDRARVAFHFDMPAGNNVAGVANATAYKEWQELDGSTLGSTIPNLSTDDPTEDSNITAGSVIEYVDTVQFDANASNAAKQGVIEAKWTELNSIIPARIVERVKFWKFSGDVV